MKRQISENGYINIQAFMVLDLKLKGIQLLVYAIIYGFSQTQSQECTAGLKYFQEWTNSSEYGVIKAIKALTEKGYIEKSNGSANKNTYRAVLPVPGTKKSESTTQQSSEEQPNKVEDRPQQSLVSDPNKVEDVPQQSLVPDPNKVEGRPQRSLGEPPTKLRTDPNKVEDVPQQSLGNNIIYYNNNINNNIYACEDKIYELYSSLTELDVMPQIAADINVLLKSGIECELICETLKKAARLNIERRRIWAYAHKILLSCEKQGIKTQKDFLNQKAYGNAGTNPEGLETQRIIEETRKTYEMLKSLEVGA